MVVSVEMGGEREVGGDGGGKAELVWFWGKYWDKYLELIPSSRSLILSVRIATVSPFLLMHASWLVLLVWAKFH